MVKQFTKRKMVLYLQIKQKNQIQIHFNKKQLLQEKYLIKVIPQINNLVYLNKLDKIVI